MKEPSADLETHTASIAADSDGEVSSADARPAISIVIPVHNQWSATQTCLEALRKVTDGVAFEIIVVDDASTDATAGKLRGFPEVRVVTLEKNAGFLEATNAGAREVRGDWILLLNNDTEVAEGALDLLIAAAGSAEAIGAVGAKLVYPDGSQQEAGGIIWDDGLGWNFGRGDDPDLPPYLYRREVDYCSAAALLVRRSAWEELGGFDPRYRPAYYEDADLCFALRDLGYRVLLEPRAVVVHYEGVSHGTDLGQGVKAYQRLNHGKFVAKWRDALAGQLPHDGTLAGLARERAPRGRVLYVDHQLPARLEDEGSLRVFEYIGILRDLGFAVTFLPHNRAFRADLAGELADLGVEVYFDYDSRQIVERLAPELTMAVLNRPDVSWNYLTHLRHYAPDCRIVYDTHDLHFVREQRRLGATPHALAEVQRYVDALREQELSLARSSDATNVVSPVERDILLSMEPRANVVHISLVHEPSASPVPDFSERSDVLFLGGFRHTPNIDAAMWLAEDILPRMLEKDPAIRLHIVGQNPPEDLVALESDHLVIHGWVADIEPFLFSAKAMVAPLRYGAGVKGKIATALSHGLPIVTTPMGVEGMGLVHGTDALIGDSAEEMARLAVLVGTDETLWRHLSHCGQVAARERYGRDVARRGLIDMMEGIDVLDRDSLVAAHVTRGARS